MTEQFLSQDEVDALLEGVTGESQKLDQPEPTEGIRAYNLGNQERIVRGRMPTMEIINERFARNFRIGLFNFMRRSPEISVGPVRVIKYSAFVRDIAVPTNINILSLAPLRGSGLLIFDPTLVFTVIDTLFGGTGKLRFRIEGRDFSATEQRIIQRLVQVATAEYAKAWGSLFKFEFFHQRSEMHTQFANIASPSEIVVATTFNVEIGDSGGEVHFCFPYASLEPIRDLLYSSLQADGQEPDRRWVRQLTQQVQSAEVELCGELATTPMRLGDLIRLQVGDFVPLPLRDIIPVKVDGVPVMECSFGTVNGHIAVRIERLLKYSHFSDTLAIEES
ncbi:MAG TPA: flagellar motor switch protein FliM [Burkholderiaceae bacterium]|jgi:flagellar motor switch protein FliM|nr:flagellar motor switch protein FliM [Burkholderiaceae bacterium]